MKGFCRWLLSSGRKTERSRWLDSISTRMCGLILAHRKTALDLSGQKKTAKLMKSGIITNMTAFVFTGGET